MSVKITSCFDFSILETELSVEKKAHAKKQSDMSIFLKI